MNQEIKSCCNCPSFDPVGNTCNYDIKIPARKIELNNLPISKKPENLIIPESLPVEQKGGKRKNLRRALLFQS